MKKLKKVFMSFGVFITGLISKVLAVSISEQTKYGVFDPRMVEDKYGVFEPTPTMGEKISIVGKFAIPIVLFVIGLFVILNKKITKKVKAIVISVLVALTILGVILMNYISSNF